MARMLRRGLTIAMALVAAQAVLASAAGAFSEVTMFSEGDYVGGGTQRVFHSGNAQISIAGTPASVNVGVSGGTSGDSYTLQFAAPPGKSLVTGGLYLDAQRAPFREAGRPGIDIPGDGRGCNTQAGRFEVVDLNVGADGQVNRLWIVYEQH